MTTCFLAPDPIQSMQCIPGGAVPASGGQLFFYVSLSSTKQTVYKDSAAAVAWSNPIVLDSGGNLPLGGSVWFPTGQTFTIVFAPANDTDPPASPYWTKNNYAGQNDVTATSSDWVTGPTPTYIGGTSFSVAGDQTLTFTIGRRIKSTNTGGTIYSTITSPPSFGGGITTVRVVSDSGTLDAGLSAVFYGLIDPASPSIDFYHVGKDGGTVVSAATTDIWGIKGTQVHISGTNAIFSFSSAAYAGGWRTVIADGVFPINHNASLIALPGGINVTTAVGDRFGVIASSAASAVVTWYQRSNSTAMLVPQTSGQVYAGPASGTTSVIPSFRTLVGTEAANVLLMSRSVVNSSFIAIGTSDIQDWSLYDEIEFHMVRLNPSQNGTVLNAQLSSTGTLNYASSVAYSHSLQFWDPSSFTPVIVTSATANFSLTELISAQTTSAFYSYSGVFRMFTPSVSGINKQLTLDHCNYVKAGLGTITTGRGSVSFNGDTNPVNGIKFFYSAGNVSTGTVYAYGIRKS